MQFTRRQFLGTATLAACAGCARVKQSRIGQLTPDFEFGGDGVAKFAAIGDFHLVDSRSVGIVGRAVNRINNEPDLDFVVVLGDLTHNGTLPQMNLAFQALDRLEKPYYCVPGEHDLNAGIENPYAFYRRTFGKTQWRHHTEGWVLFGLDTCGGTTEQPAVDPESLDWLENQLSHTDKDKPIALLTHHPFNPGSGANRVSNAADVLARFGEHQLRVVASGHQHGNLVEQENGVIFTTTASCSSTVENIDDVDANGFRLFTLEGANVQHEFVAVT